jgi:deoxyribodipyrimidine photolyase
VSVAIVLFTRDLRVHDHAALAAATTEYEQVVPLFVLDEALLRDAGTPNRISFLLESLRSLRTSAATSSSGVATSSRRSCRPRLRLVRRRCSSARTSASTRGSGSANCASSWRPAL